MYSEESSDGTSREWQRRMFYYSQMNLTVISGSEWHYNQLLQSSLFANTPKEKIFLPIDNKIFKHTNKADARKFLGLPNKKKIVFFGAAYWQDKRKGIKELVEAFNILHKQLDDESQNEIHLVIAGRLEPEMENLFQFTSTILGPIDFIKLSIVFNASDFFVCSSIEDSGPMMINQSIMCGTPVVAFEMGIAIDLVIPNKTGYRAKLGNSEDLARGMQTLLACSEAEQTEMTHECLKLSDKLLHPDIFKEKIGNILK